MSAHSKLGASSMYRWSACPGSVALCETVPESPSSPYAEEGTKAHEMAAGILEQPNFDTSSYPEGMEEAVRVYTDTVTGDYLDALKNKKSWLMVEHRFDLRKVRDGLFGTADAVLYDAVTKTLRVYDYKHGAGIAVDVEANSQLLYYALGAYLTTDADPETVEIVVVQPRCAHAGEPVRRWKTTPQYILDFSMELLRYVEATEKPDAPLSPGDHCRFCPAAAVCPAIVDKANAIAKLSFADVKTYDPAKVSEALGWVPILKDWIAAVEEFAESELKAHRPIPGYKLVAKKTHRKWKDEETAISALEEAGLSSDDLFTKKLLTPAQAEKLLGKGGKTVVEELAEAPPGSLTIAPEADPREAVTLIDAKDSFKDVE